MHTNLNRECEICKEMLQKNSTLDKVVNELCQTSRISKNITSKKEGKEKVQS